jgi:hypothetical protein
MHRVQVVYGSPYITLTNQVGQLLEVLGTCFGCQSRPCWERRFRRCYSIVRILLRSLMDCVILLIWVARRCDLNLPLATCLSVDGLTMSNVFPLDDWTNCTVSDQ